MNDSIKNYVEFTVWNNTEERPATAEEINAHVRIRVIADGYCKIETDDGYSLLSE